MRDELWNVICNRPTSFAAVQLSKFSHLLMVPSRLAAVPQMVVNTDAVGWSWTPSDDLQLLNI
jgi:hypothetical protein